MFIFKKRKQPKDLKEVLKQFSDLQKEFEEIERELKELKEKNKMSIQKIGIVRYNPFSGVGSDQSFSIALLDENNSGIVITSLYSSGGNRVYAKPIKQGASDYLLSEEEKKAINKAITNRLNIKNQNAK